MPDLLVLRSWRALDPCNIASRGHEQATSVWTTICDKKNSSQVYAQSMSTEPGKVDKLVQSQGCPRTQEVESYSQGPILKGGNYGKEQERLPSYPSYLSWLGSLSPVLFCGPGTAYTKICTILSAQSK